MAIFDFENGLPPELSVIGGKAAIEKEQSKEGKQSLKWDFREKDQLVFTTEIGYGTSGTKATEAFADAFGMYLFGLHAEGHLHVGFEKNNREAVGFDVTLGFAGWRSIAVCFDRDMTGTAQEGMDRLVITAFGTGSLLLDEIVTAGKIDLKYVMASYQVPFIQNGLSPMVSSPVLPQKYYAQKADPDALKRIKERTVEYLEREYPGNKTAEELQKAAEELHLKEGRFGIRGERVEFEGRVADALCGKKRKAVSIYYVTDLLLQIAVSHHQKPEEEKRKLYLKVYRYLIAQGIDEGSSFGTHMILDYGLRRLYPSFLLMEEALKEAGLTEQTGRIMRWFLHMDAFGFAEGVPERKATCDDFGNIAGGILFYILLCKKGKEQSAYLYAFTDWLDRNLEYMPGLMGLLKEDGCIFHHHGHYIAYGQCALNGITPILWTLEGTGYDVSGRSRAHIRHVLETLHFQCFKRQIPIALSGRHPLGNQVLQTKMFEYAAPDLLEKEAQEANRSYPMACAMVHRRNGWEAVIKGYSRYLWGSEIYEGCNLYGRYRSYGVLELLTEQKGFFHDGYDWNCFPGTTAIHLPFEKLKAQIQKPDVFCGYEEMLLSDQSFAGSVSLGKNGMFSMILTEHPKYEGSHKAYKSYFLLDDFILCLGSGIRNISEYPTETTLFQDAAERESDTVLLNGKAFQGEYCIGEKDRITDIRGNHYFPEKGTKIRIRQGIQESPSSTGDGIRQGKFATAVISHGIRPNHAGYLYGIGVRGGKKKAYEVLRRDEIAHVVKIDHISYYAIFVPEKFDRIQSNVPILIMLKEQKEEYFIAVCDPDLGLYGEDASQYDAGQTRKEVSIYSRKWVTNPVKTQEIRVVFPEYGFSLSAVVRGGEVRTFRKKKALLRSED